MVSKRYIGVMFPEAEFTKLRSAFQHLRQLQGCCAPAGKDYKVLDAAISALKDAGTHFTKNPKFYEGGPS
jgi:hypothetical protein